MTALVHLDNGVVRATIAPGIGGTVIDVAHVPSGLSALGRVPWKPELTPPARAAMTEDNWLPHYSGGWPILFPNGGAACLVDGIKHGFHGEGSVVPWVIDDHGPRHLTLSHRFATVPAMMQRRFTLDGATLTIAETAQSTAPLSVIWGQHVTFGSDMLDGPFHIDAGPATLHADPDYDPPGNPIRPGAVGTWPHLPGAGTEPGSVQADLSRPADGWAALAYLTGMSRPEITVARDDGHLAATLSWEGEVLSCVWLWIELAATAAPPWNGQARLLGVEPCSTPAGHGLREARRRGDRLVQLNPDLPVHSVTRLRLHA